VFPDPLVAVERGLAVFPIPPGGNRPASRDWQRRALRHVDDVRREWRPGDNIGIGCWASGVVGLDLDVADGHHHTDVDGADTLAAVCAAHGQPWPRTLTVCTPSTGRHLYLSVPPGRVVLSSSGGRSGLGPGIDVRGPGRGQRGGYLIGPGSVVGGRRYTIANDVPISELPAWMADLLAPPVPALAHPQ
jgi:hypothetical protein